MLGAIIGDIVGSIYEWHNIKTKEFPLFGKNCEFTDDSVMTITVAEGLMDGGKVTNRKGAFPNDGAPYSRYYSSGQWTLRKNG